MKFGTWHFRIGYNRRGNYKPRWFWMVLFAILVAELLYNIASILIHAPINALMILLLSPMVVFIWTRLWFLIELRTGSATDRDELSAYDKHPQPEPEESAPATSATSWPPSQPTAEEASPPEQRDDNESRF